MSENKTIGISALIAMGLIVASMVTPSFFDEPKYVCESRLELGYVECDNFTKYVDDNGKCIRDDQPNLICRDGWKLVINDSYEEVEEPIIDNPIYEDSGSKEYLCYPPPRFECGVVQ